MKNRFVLFIAGCCVLLLSSCMKSNETENELSHDCQILSFTLANDSISGLSNVLFTIDQLTGQIFNKDSMPYGTVLDEKVICSVNLGFGVMQSKIMQEATGDTILRTRESNYSFLMVDSLDFSKPVKFVNVMWDGMTTRAYRAWVNIHQVEPDSMVWSLFQDGISDQTIKEEKVVVCEKEEIPYYYMYIEPTNASLGYQLYRSPVSDGQNWTKLSVNGLPNGEVCLSQITVYENVFFAITTSGVLYTSIDGAEWVSLQVKQHYPVKALLGSLNADDDYTGAGKQASALAGIIEKDGELIYAFIDHDTRMWQWDEMNAVISEGFPVKNFGQVSYSSMHRARLMLVAGRDKNNQLTNRVWATDNGKVWAELTAQDTTYFPKQEGVSVVQYDEKFFMLSGIDENGKASSEILLSKDGGVSWSVSDTLVVMPQEFKARGFSSIHVDNEQFMYVFGGKERTNANVMNQIWRGRINRLGFED